MRVKKFRQEGGRSGIIFDDVAKHSMSRVRMRKHVPCAKPFPSVDVGRRESHVTVRERTEEMKSPQNNDSQECAACVQNPSKCFVSEEKTNS